MTVAIPAKPPGPRCLSCCLGLFLASVLGDGKAESTLVLTRVLGGRVAESQASPALAEGEFPALRLSTDLTTPEESEVMEPMEPMGPGDEALGADALPVVFGVWVNRQNQGEAMFLRLPGNRLLARREDLRSWRLSSLPPAATLLYRGEEYYDLAALRGVTVTLDKPAQMVALEIAPEYFAATTLGGGAPLKRPPLNAAGRGGFFNYDLMWGGTANTHALDGTFELGAFNGWGVASGNFLVRGIDGQPRTTRLETALTKDFPDTTRTLVLGDTLGSGGLWGRPVRYGGFSYGTNFATDPTFITSPMPSLRGQSALPATSELYVDGVLRQTSAVPPGPFQITDLPVITGQGNVKLVVRDLLGREQVISQPYISSGQLLRSGLVDEGVQMGWQRFYYGLASADYGSPFGTLQRRQGVTDTVTLEQRLELAPGRQTGGVGGVFALSGLGVMNVAAAASHSDAGGGSLLSAGFQNQARQGISASLAGQWYSPGFRQTGNERMEHLPLRQWSANGGVSVGGGSFSLSYMRQDNRGEPSIRVASANYTLTLGAGTTLMATAFRSQREQSALGVAITLTIALGDRLTGSASTTRQRGGASQFMTEVQRSLPAGVGAGYRLRAGRAADVNQQEADFLVQGEYGNYELDLSHVGQSTAQRLGMNGGLGLVDGQFFAARNLRDAFAIAAVPGFPDVGVYLNNQLVSRTDAGGYARLPNLMAYQTNQVRVDPTDLPLDAEIESTELQVVPSYRSGVSVRFPIRRSRSALLVLVLEDGTPLPVGSRVRIAGSSEEFPVAHRGEVYLRGISEHNDLVAEWKGQACRLALDVPSGSAPLPRLGPVLCPGVAP